MRLILADENVQAVLFNIFGGITRCDEVARGILTALEEIVTDVPMVARLVGTNEQEGRAILAEAKMITAATLEEAAQKAVEDARTGNGPSLIECMTYRWRGHVGPGDDLDKGLRSREELEYWMNRCPIKLFEQHLLEQGIINELERDKIHSNIGREVEKALIFARESPLPDPGKDNTLNVFKGHM